MCVYKINKLIIYSGSYSGKLSLLFFVILELTRISHIFYHIETSTLVNLSLNSYVDLD